MGDGPRAAGRRVRPRAARASRAAGTRRPSRREAPPSFGRCVGRGAQTPAASQRRRLERAAERDVQVLRELRRGHLRPAEEDLLRDDDALARRRGELQRHDGGAVPQRDRRCGAAAVDDPQREPPGAGRLRRRRQHEAVVAGDVLPARLGRQAREERRRIAHRLQGAVCVRAGFGRVGRDDEIALRLAPRAARRDRALQPERAERVELGPLAGRLPARAVPDPRAEQLDAVAGLGPREVRERGRVACGLEARRRPRRAGTTRRGRARRRGRSRRPTTARCLPRPRSAIAAAAPR